MFEAVGNMHMHTPYSDGTKWHREIADDAIDAGLDFIIVTDHNVWVDGVEGYYENENGRVLLLVGQEIHHVRRVPQASHCLVYGTEQEMSSYMADPQSLIDAVKAAGGYTFLAHPHEKDLTIFKSQNLGWHDWDIEGFTGLEIWNYLSGFKNRLADACDGMRIQHRITAMLVAARVSANPQKYITGPEPETLALWDKLLAEGKRVAAVGNSDAHGATFGWGPFKRVIYPYPFVFRAVNTHVLLSSPLNGDLAHDKHHILHAIGNGHAWVGYDMAHPTQGFRFIGHGVSKGKMGDKIQLDAGATLQVKTPVKANIRLIRHGQVVSQTEGETHLTHIPVEPGAYRVECTIAYEGQQRGWIFSNPIYLYE